MLTKVHIRDHEGLPLCNVKTKYAIGTGEKIIMIKPFEEFAKLRQTAQCHKCAAKALKMGWFKASTPTVAQVMAKTEPREDFCQPAGYTGPYTRKQAEELATESAAGICGNKYPLHFGPVNDPHSEETYDTHQERLAQMWAARLCKHPETAWFNDSRDPGVITNEKFNLELFDALSDQFKSRVRKIIAEDDRLCFEGEETESIDDAADKLIQASEDALKYIKYHSPSERLTATERKERERIVNELTNTIEDMRLWLEGISEANQTPAQMGWVGKNGQP